jgi:hypothetical protein
VSLAAAALAGFPASAVSQVPTNDSVTGTARDCVESFQPAPGQPICARRLVIQIDAVSDAAGGQPSGSVSWQDLGLTPGGSFSVTAAQVTCLAVSGNVAIIGLTGSLVPGGVPPEPFQTPIAGLVRVVDGGGPDSGADTIERAIQTGPKNGSPLPGPVSCSTFPGPFPRSPSLFPDFVNETGDIVVVDAPALPTSRDQCKNGGWRNFPGFTNQGACVRFVATGGKPRPGS